MRVHERCRLDSRSSMRALVISDTHFGAWTGRDLLREEFFLERLAPALDGIDELIFLGDLFDFLFGSVDDAVDAADGLLRLIAEKMVGGRLVFLAGNHDHHLVHRDEEDRLETKLASGHRPSVADRPRLLPRIPRAPPARGRDRDRLPDLPLRRRPLHPRPLPRPARAPQRLARRPPADPDAVGDRRRRPRGAELHRGLRVGDDAADRVALHRRPDAARHPRPAERLPRRPAGGALRPGAGRAGPRRRAPGGEAARPRPGGDRRARAAAERGALRRRRPRRGRAPGARAAARRPRRRRGRSTRSRPWSRAATPPSTRSRPSPRSSATSSWGGEGQQIVFAHTHQPLADVRCVGDGRNRYWNTGSWIYEPDLGSRQAYARYLRYAWPGTAILIDDRRAAAAPAGAARRPQPAQRRPRPAEARRRLIRRSRAEAWPAVFGGLIPILGLAAIGYVDRTARCATTTKTTE